MSAGGFIQGVMSAGGFVHRGFCPRFDPANPAQKLQVKYFREIKFFIMNTKHSHA